MKKIQKSIFKWEKKLKKFKSIPNRNVLDSIRMNNCKEILNDLKAIDKDINNDYLIMTSRQIAEEIWNEIRLFKASKTSSEVDDIELILNKYFNH